MSDQLLSDLCSICNTTKSKYRCPGCSARTCSLPCYKRHQQWAQCSGKRDPTKFVKKSQLMTPAGVDHDFNFLTGIERDIQKAEKGLTENDDRASTKPRGFSNHKGQVNYHQLEAAGVKVIRAPKGMSRQKENKSHRSNTKKSTGGNNVVWTIEWLDNQTQRLITQTSSTCQIIAAHPFSPREQNKKKRKRQEEASIQIPSDVQHTKDTSNEPDKELRPSEEISNQTRDPSPKPSGSNAPADQSTAGDVTDARHADPGEAIESQPVDDKQYQFYLVKPRTSSSRQVLIPLNPSATLGESLQGRTVLEFPTIHVFPSSMPTLPEGFMLEQEYLKEEGEQQKEFDELIQELDPDILRRLKEDTMPTQRGTAKEHEVVDDKAILDVLKKDFGT